jgi:DNA-binding response OmpR family regulator
LQAISLTTAQLTLDRSRNEVQHTGHDPVRLTPLEVRLLETLMLNPGQVLPTESIITHVWGVDGGDRAMLKQLVYRLRGKLEPQGDAALIETIPGVGYTLVDEHA